MSFGMTVAVAAFMVGAATPAPSDDALAVNEAVFTLLDKRAARVKRIEQGPPVAKLDRFGDMTDAISLKNRILADGTVDDAERAFVAALQSDAATIRVQHAERVLAVRNLSYPAAKALVRSIS